MHIRRWDWDLQAYVTTDYPETLFEPFLDWLFTTKQWREDPERFNERVWELEKDLVAHRVKMAVVTMPLVPPELTPAERKAAGIAKARISRAATNARKRAEREAVHAQG